MLSAPATISATNAVTLTAPFAPAGRGTLRCWPTRSCNPARWANPRTGTRPAADTRFGSSKTGALLLAVTLRPQLGRRWFVGFYALLAFNPVIFSGAYSRVHRDQLVASLPLLALALGAHLATSYADSHRWSRRRHWGVVFETLLLGVVIGRLAITRVDSVWVVLATSGAFVVGIPPALRHLNRRAGLRIAARAATVALLGLSAPFGVALVNEHWYSVRLLDDDSQGAFAEALALWSSVEVEGSDPFMTVSEDQRAAVCAISRTAGRSGPSWRTRTPAGSPMPAPGRGTSTPSATTMAVTSPGHCATRSSSPARRRRRSSSRSSSRTSPTRSRRPAARAS